MVGVGGGGIDITMPFIRGINPLEKVLVGVIAVRGCQQTVIAVRGCQHTVIAQHTVSRVDGHVR